MISAEIGQIQGAMIQCNVNVKSLFHDFVLFVKVVFEHWNDQWSILTFIWIHQSANKWNIRHWKPF